ncbi:Glyoxalase/Bleomycin resistance protein/Dihydroxybiphenyl dioxygenase [Rhizodiscina lignyota]|uniref:Glyoxalase/Bleomycin resistance protein/Dihydroxybiphenyl dioxygenase n=1 Tax=Rhizodiscina lignyota TaxID=1504668 RepID=A0A9P4MDT1_9PEZI|nr:Glyoxalase/Bleomycin resistance protein/Dihydroxybiphenyl dioxygenase [Rhizodiscina lignyota]
MAAACVVKSIDHVVLTCKSIPATVEFYTKWLGMKHDVFTSSKDPGIERHALLFGSQKINLHQHGKEFEPKAQNVMPGSADLCFITDDPVEDVLKALKADKVDVLEGGQVVDRTGARGVIRSVYVRDPDLNLVEISNYK